MQRRVTSTSCNTWAVVDPKEIHAFSYIRLQEHSSAMARRRNKIRSCEERASLQYFGCIMERMVDIKLPRNVIRNVPYLCKGPECKLNPLATPTMSSYRCLPRLCIHNQSVNMTCFGDGWDSPIVPSSILLLEWNSSWIFILAFWGVLSIDCILLVGGL